MNKMIKTTGTFLKKNSSHILTNIGVVGFINTAILSARAHKKASNYLQEMTDIKLEDMTNVDKLKYTWQFYIPPFISGVASAACIYGAHNINVKRNAALVSLYSISENTLKEYQKKVVEKIGENKVREIRDELAQEKVTNNPISERTVVEPDPTGDYLCMDSFSGRYFRSSVEYLRRIENDCNKTIIQDNYMSLNEVYYGMGLRGIDMGDLVGFHLDCMVEFGFSSTLTEKDEPCLVVSFINKPEYKYEDVH